VAARAVEVVEPDHADELAVDNVPERLEVRREHESSARREKIEEHHARLVDEESHQQGFPFGLRSNALFS
jgi:hypothetical protein